MGVAFCWDPSSVQWRCFDIWHPNGQFGHMICLLNPWQSRRLCQADGSLYSYPMHVEVGEYWMVSVTDAGKGVSVNSVSGQHQQMLI